MPLVKCLMKPGCRCFWDIETAMAAHDCLVQPVLSDVLYMSACPAAQTDMTSLLFCPVSFYLNPCWHASCAVC